MSKSSHRRPRRRAAILVPLDAAAEFAYWKAAAQRRREEIIAKLPPGATLEYIGPSLLSYEWRINGAPKYVDGETHKAYLSLRTE